MKRTHKLLASAFCMIAMLLAACGGGGAATTTTSPGAHAKAPANKQVLVSVVSAGAGISDFDTLDPALVVDVASATAIDTIFTGLVEMDSHLQVHPQLAQSWDKSADGMTYTFHLKPNLKFSDGTPLTSHDVAWSIDRAFQPATKSSTALYYMGFIKDSDKLSSGSIKTLIGDSLLTPDDNTIIIKLNKPVAYFLDGMTYPCSYTVEKSLIDKYGTKWTDHLTEGGGDGPFKVKQYAHNRQLELVPNTDYYGPKPQLQELIYPFYKDSDTTLKDYLVNRLDDATVPLSEYTTYKSHPDFWRIPYLRIDYLTMSYTKKPFDNIKIRQAFALAVNKDLIVKNIWKGSFIATNHIVPQGMPGYNADLTGPDGTKSTAGNPTLAKQLLKQGMQEEGLTTLPSITLNYADAGVQATDQEMAAMQQMWQTNLGVSVKLENVDINTFNNNISAGVSANPYQFYQSGWIADYPDPQDWITLQFGKDASDNSMGFGQNNSPNASAQQALQQQMAQADVMQDPNARLKAYNQIEQQLVNDVAWMPIDQETLYGVRKPCVQNFVVTPQQLTPPDAWGNIYISTDTPCANATVS
jgi:oligopeptide transport system substrate-binding protein